MNLFTAAMGGAGESLQGMAQTWVREESAGNLAKLNNDLDMQKARLVNELRMKADRAQIDDQTAAQKSILDYQVSTDYSDARAAAAGKVKRAEGDNTIREVNPGNEVWRGGERLGTSAVPTPAQVVDKQVREGLRVPVGGSRKAVDPQKRSDFDKMFDPKQFKDADGNVDYGRMSLHKGLAEAIFEQTHDPAGSFALAGDAISRATATATAAAKDDPTKFKPTLEAELARLAKKAGVAMPKSVFDAVEASSAAATDDGSARRAEELRTRTAEAQRRVDESNRQMRMTPAELRAELVATQERRAEVEGEPQVRNRPPRTSSPEQDAEIAGLTIDRIKRMTPAEAGATYRKYYTRLTLDQRRALTGRM